MKKTKIAHTVILDTYRVLQDNEIHNSIAAAFRQNSHSSADIPNILGMVFPKQAANNSTRICHLQQRMIEGRGENCILYITILVMLGVVQEHAVLPKVIIANAQAYVIANRTTGGIFNLIFHIFPTIIKSYSWNIESLHRAKFLMLFLPQMIY